MAAMDLLSPLPFSFNTPNTSLDRAEIGVALLTSKHNVQEIKFCKGWRWTSWNLGALGLLQFARLEGAVDFQPTSVGFDSQHPARSSRPIRECTASRERQNELGYVNAIYADSQGKP